MTTPPAATSPDPASRAVWLAIILIVAAFIATGTGVLAFLAGAHPATAVLTGGAAFAGAAGLLLALLRYARGEG